MAFNIKDRKWLGYFVYVVLVTGALLYLLFPAETVEEFVNSSVRKVDPGLSFSADRIGPRLPAGLLFAEPKIIAEGSGQSPILRAASIYVGPKIFKLVKGEQQLNFDGRAYNGEMDGWLNLSGESSEQLAGEVNFTNFDLAAHDILSKLPGYKLIGSTGGNISFNGKNMTAVDDLNGKAVLQLSGGQLQFQEALFGIESIDLQRGDFELELNHGKLNVIKAELSGSEVKGSVTGSVQLQKDIMQSTLNLKGNLEPLAEFYKNNPGIRELLKTMKKRVKRGQYFFAITGTLDAPRFKLL